jgi:arylsulfatase A-like enzyme
MSHYAIHVPYDADPRFTQNYCDSTEKGIFDTQLGQRLNQQEINHAALIEGMDKSLGDIMDFLDRHPQVARNTILIFMSDNGGQSVSVRQGRPNIDQNFPARGGKGSALEGGIHEPMMVLWPGVTQGGGVCRQRVIIEDFFPTLLHMAGIRDYNTIQHIDGKSFVLALYHPRRQRERTLIFHYPNTWVANYEQAFGFGAYSAIMKGDYHLIYFWETQQFQLYNRSRDIAEVHDLSAQHPRLLRRLARELTDSLISYDAQRPSMKVDGTSVPWPSEMASEMNRRNNPVSLQSK